MKIADKERIIETQMTLFERQAIRTLGQARFLIGHTFEKCTHDRTGAVWLQTDSQCDSCPDFWYLKENHYIEVKAAGRSHKVIVFESRVTLEREMMESSGKVLMYYIWRHSLQMNHALKISDYPMQLSGMLKASCFELLMVDARILHEATRKVCKRRLNYRNNEPMIGWTLDCRQLRRFADRVEPIKF